MYKPRQVTSTGKVGYEDVEELELRAVLEIKDDESYAATMQIMRSQKLIKKLEEALMFLLAFRNKNKDKILPQINDKIKAVKDKIAQVELDIENRIEKSSEAYTMYRAMQLVDFQKQMNVNGGKIVETESVHRYATQIEEAILEGKPILLQGPPGTGKTEIAKHVADKIRNKKSETENPKEKYKSSAVDGDSEEVKSAKTKRGIEDYEKRKAERQRKIEPASAFYIVSGSKDFHYSEFAGTGGVRTNGISREEFKKIEEEIEGSVLDYVKKYKKENDDMEPSESDKMEFRKYKKDILLEMYSNGMETYFNYGPIYKAMEEGVPLIVDEANLIPPGVILKLNEYLTRRAGDTVRVQENGGKEIVIQKGFSIIYTGNVGVQFEREKLDASQRDRMGLVIDYDYVPNSILTKTEEDALVQKRDAEQDENKKAKLTEEIESIKSHSELWHIMLAGFMDKKCRMQLPAGDEDDLWQFSKAVRYAQDVYAGRIDVQIPSATGGPSAISGAAAIKEYQLSMRSVFSMLDEYKKDNTLPLSYYITQKFLTEKSEGNKNAIAVYSKIFKDFGLLPQELSSLLNVRNPRDRENAKEGLRRKIATDKNSIKKSGELEMITYSSRDIVRLAFGRDTNFDTESSMTAYEKRFQDLETPELKNQREQAEQERLEAERLENIRQQQAERLDQLEALKLANQEAINQGLEIVKSNKVKLEQIKSDLEALKNDPKTIEADIKKIPAKITKIGTLIVATDRGISEIEDTLNTKGQSFDFSNQEKVDVILEKLETLKSKQEKATQQLSQSPTPLTIKDLTLLNTANLEVKSINPKDILTAKNPTPAKAGIYHWNTFKDNIYPITKETSTPESLSYTNYNLDTRQHMQNMIDNLGGIDKVKFWTLDQIAQLIENQSDITGDIPNLNSPLLTDGKSNIFLSKDKDGKAVALSAYWGSANRRWCLLAYDLSNEWSAGGQLFLRN